MKVKMEEGWVAGGAVQWRRGELEEHRESDWIQLSTNIDVQDSPISSDNRTSFTHFSVMRTRTHSRRLRLQDKEHTHSEREKHTHHNVVRITATHTHRPTHTDTQTNTLGVC